ncbi:hypothetical protein B0H21DRAFT_475303 [Amylocystis lapponica]|nr:hypothetical protein B0H21DRAFT_475303 [Amylocystis lapponica]
MVEHSRRPLTTYARRRARPNAVDAGPSPQTSPLKPLPPDKHDVTLSEMAHRMKKRSRQTDSQVTISSSPGFSSHGSVDGERLAKKLKQRSESASTSDFSGPNARSNAFIFPLKGQDANEISFQTPLSFLPSDQSMKSSPSAPLDQLSPVPIAKRVLSRTNSYNFKENRLGSALNGLASPFHSRPGSRAASPHGSVKNKIGRPPFHMKSRTLSTNQRGDVTVIAPTLQPETSVLAPAPFIDALDPQPPMDVLTGKSKTTANVHIRTGSIPSISSSHNDMSPSSWLIPAKALTRPSPAMQLDLDAEHSSFFYDAPNHVSTPPRKRRATTGTWALDKFPQCDENGGFPVPPNPSSDVNMAHASRPSTPPSPKPPTPPPRRRRRTIVHLPRNAQFSAVLDFSSQTLAENPSSVLESVVDTPDQSIREDPPQPCQFHAGLDLQNFRSGLGRGLASAFSSARSSPTTSSSEPALSSLDTVDSATATDVIMDGPLSPFRARPGPDLDQEELRDMFSVLRFDGAYTLCLVVTIRALFARATSKLTICASYCADDEKWASVAVSRSSPELSITLARSRSYEPPAPNSARTKEQTHRRKRGDTIRASDFAPLSESEADKAGSPRPPPTRRTRSGTVTLSTIVASAGQAQVPPPAPAYRRRNGALPMTKVAINDEALCAAAEDSDDELLLRPGGCLY